MRESERETNQTRGPRGDSERKKVRSREREIARERGRERIPKECGR